jgi:hypothetical protein
MSFFEVYAKVVSDAFAFLCDYLQPEILSFLAKIELVIFSNDKIYSMLIFSGVSRSQSSCNGNGRQISERFVGVLR